MFGWYPGSEPDALTRVVNWFSYFTNVSTIFCIVGLAMLARDPQWDGRWFRPVRLAGLVGITVTFFVYLVALRPDQVLDGIHIWTNAGYHVVVPILTVAGLLVFGPFPRADGRSLRLTLLWLVPVRDHRRVVAGASRGPADRRPDPHADGGCCRSLQLGRPGPLPPFGHSSEAPMPH